MPKKSQKDDPTKDPKFKRVVEHFLKTPPKPRDDTGKAKRKPKKEKPAK